MSRILIVALVLLGVAGGVARAEVIDRVLAVVSGDLILLSDVEAATIFGLVTPKGPDRVGSVLAELVDRELMLSEVDRYAPPEPPASAVDRDLEAIQRRFASPDAFQAALARTGLDVQQLRTTLRENLRIAAYIDQRFVVVSPTDEEVRAYYTEHRADFTKSGRPRSFEDARADAAGAWMRARRKALVDQWLGDLRRRADLIELYLPAPRRPAGSR